MEFRNDDLIKDILLRNTGKNGYIILKSGKEYYGIIKEVGQHCVYLEKVSGRDFFDGVINIADIAAVEIKVRGP